MSHPPMTARRAAVHLLDQVLEEQLLLSEALASGVLTRLDPAERARAQRLATDTLRGLERADRLLQKHLRKYPPMHVRNVLRMATVELAHGGDAHGVVNEAVNIVASHKRHNRIKGLVNAVLRKMADEAPAKWDTLRIPRLPKWLRGPLVQAYGNEPMIAIEAAHFAGAPLDLTAKTDAAAVAEATGGTLLPTGRSA